MSSRKKKPGTKCRICGDPTKVGFNIRFKLVNICEDCATSIFIQQAQAYAKAYWAKHPPK